ncbi:MAG: hypothetical protein GF355_06960 [Candidatus Eisenbacteria bacterium]|nr:hypothetical protein [Candidatus Eisenbacteria bacterium]
MRSLITKGIGMLAVAALLVPGSAMAMLELDLGFDPTEVCPGDDVQFFFSLENIGDEAEMVEMTVMVTFDDFEIGPITGTFELAAGEEVTKEIGLMVPPPTPPGTLTIYASATDSDGTVEDTAELTINDCRGANQSANPRALLNDFRKALGSIGLR